MLFCLLAAPAYGQESIGLFNSIKGIGAAVRLPEKDGIFHSAYGFIDVYGVATGRCSYPGFRLNVSRNYVISRSDKADYSMCWYAGPGITAGYIRDHDKGRGIDLVTLFGNNEGLALALSGTGGLRFDFHGPFSLDLSFTADLGIHIRRYEHESGYFAPSVSIFNNGFLQALYPQLTILYRL